MRRRVWTPGREAVGRGCELRGRGRGPDGVAVRPPSGGCPERRRSYTRTFSMPPFFTVRMNWSRQLAPRIWRAISTTMYSASMSARSS